MLITLRKGMTRLDTHTHTSQIIQMMKKTTTQATQSQAKMAKNRGALSFFRSGIKRRNRTLFGGWGGIVQPDLYTGQYRLILLQSEEGAIT